MVGVRPHVGKTNGKMAVNVHTLGARLPVDVLESVLREREASEADAQLTPER
jgi:hypothetical protein